MADYKINIQINLAGLIGELQRSIQRTINLVTSGLEAKQYVTGESLRLADTSFGITLDNNLIWDREQAQKEYSKWLLINGFRDVTESAGLFLESVHNILSYWELGIRQKEEGKLTGGHWNEIIVAGGRRFHSLGFPDKLDHLSKKHKLTLNEILTSEVLSINATRNCMAHRGGVVSQKDVNCEDGLKIKWMKLTLVIQDEDGEKEVVPPFVAEKDSVLGVRNREEVKVFPLGSQVEFTVQEFSDICWCFFVFGDSLRQSVEGRGTEMGFLSKKEKTIGA